MLTGSEIFTARKQKFLHSYTITETKSFYKIQYNSGNLRIHIYHHPYYEKNTFLYLTNGLFSNNSGDFGLRAVNSQIAHKQKYQNRQKLQNSNTSESFQNGLTYFSKYKKHEIFPSNFMQKPQFKVALFLGHSVGNSTNIYKLTQLL